MSYDDILQAIGYGKFHYILLLVCGLAVAADAVEIQAISFVLPSACDLKLNDIEKGWLTAIIFIGMMVGGYVWGGLADVQGRRNILRYALFVNGLFGLISAFSPNFGFFAFCRFMSGLGVGGSMPVVFSYFTEFQPRSHRGSMITILACFWMLGTIIAAGLAWLIIPHDIGGPLGSIFFGSWRIFLCIATFPCFTVALALLFLPESPRFYLEVGERRKAIKSLQTVERFNRGALRSTLHVSHIVAIRDGKIVSTYYTVLQASKELFYQPYLRRTLILFNIWFTFSFGYYGLSLWFPELFKKFADGSTCSNRMLNANNTEIYFESFLTSISTLPGNLITVLLIDRIGRKIILACSMGSSGVAVFFIWLVNRKQDTVILSCVFSGLSIGGWNALDVLGPELYPTHLRSTAFGLQSVLGRIASVLGNLLFAQLIDVDCAIPILLVSACLGWGAISAIWLPNT
ncbi:uncharacterized protein TRIADDRAFT_36521, partial [Trichoplax adhaerens]